MKHKDLLLIAALRENARDTLTSISRKTHIPISTVFDRIRMHEGNTIRKHTAIVDFAKLGYSTRASIALKAGKDERDMLRDFLLNHPSVNSVYKINNGFDFLAESLFRSIRELEEFLECIDEKFKVRTRQVHYIIEDLKREEFLSDPDKVHLVWDDGFRTVQIGSQKS